MWRPDREEGGLLVALARSAIAQAVQPGGTGAELLLQEALERETLRRPGAAFVSLHLEDELRGCVGTLEATDPLASAVVRQAVAAASEDPRFPPVRPLELPGIAVHVSVLGPFVPVGSPESIVPGRHGVLLVHGRFRGVFLPEVAQEQGWDRVTLLEHLAVKAGLRRDDWRQAALSAFETARFGETLY